MVISLPCFMDWKPLTVWLWMHKQHSENWTGGVGSLNICFPRCKGIAILPFYVTVDWIFIFPGILAYTSFTWLLHSHLPTSHFIQYLFQTDSAFLPKKSRLPILLRSSRPLGNVPLKLREQKSDSQLQHHTRLPYEDLKACEVENKQFQAQTNGELLLSELVTENLEEEPAEENTLVRGR